MVRILGEGDHFGEVAILKNVKRTLSIRAKNSLKLLVLTREAFSRILGSIRDFLNEDYQRKDSFDTSFESNQSSEVSQTMQQSTSNMTFPRRAGGGSLPGIVEQNLEDEQ